jgi:rfaE bifunctional protein kinase chain/domain
MNWDETRVLVVGDVMLDRWIYLKKTKISPEAPIPIVVQQESFAEIGGAGNALRHLNNLSRAKHFLIGIRGLDDNGVEMVSLKGSNFEHFNLIIDSERKTTVKERFYIDGVPIFRRDSEDVNQLSQETEAEVTREVSDRINDYDVLLLSDYAKGMLSKSLIMTLLHLAKSRNIPIVSDPGLGRVSLFAGCDVIKPNAKEWQEFVQNCRDEDEALAWLFGSGTQFVIVTNGKEGVTCFSKSQTLKATPSNEISAVDVTGAGDSVAAAISLIIGSGQRIVDNLDRLNEVGGMTVGQTRTILPKI